jgi:hypothetical protein
MDSNSVDVWVAFLAAVFGGAGLKVAESILTARQRRNDLLGKTIEQKDKDLENARKAVEAAEKAEAEWREKYWELREKGVDDKP